MNIVFFGSDQFVLPVVKQLFTEYKVSRIVTTEKLPTDPISTFATQNSIPYDAIQKFTSDVNSKLQSDASDVAVLAYFGLILPNTILSLFPKGIINVHPSVLPKFRGPTPVQSAMLSGEKETGVSIIRLDDEVDHGPILAQEHAPILDTDTDETLHKRLFEKGANLLTKILPNYLDGTLTPMPQDHSQATFTTRLTRDSGYFLSEDPPTAQKLQLMIRAYYPWPGVWTKTKLRGEEKRIKFLPENLLQVQDKKPMKYKDFLNGYPEKQEWLKGIGLY